MFAFYVVIGLAVMVYTVTTLIDWWLPETITLYEQPPLRPPPHTPPPRVLRQRQRPPHPQHAWREDDDEVTA
jgi:hypothetical protein